MFPPIAPADARRDTQRDTLARQHALVVARAHTTRRRWRMLALTALAVLAFELRHPRALSTWLRVHVMPRAAAAWHWMRHDLPRVIGCGLAEICGNHGNRITARNIRGSSSATCFPCFLLWRGMWK